MFKGRAFLLYWRVTGYREKKGAGLGFCINVLIVIRLPAIFFIAF